MLTALSYEADAGTITFTVGTATGAYRVSEFTFDPEVSGDDIPMMESSGQWDAYRRVRRMTISVEGMLVGTSATDYWTRRATLMGVVLPDQGSTQPIVQGTVFATFPGQSEVYAPAVLTDYSAPVRVADGVTSSRYQLVFVNDYGYWRAVSGDAVVKL